MIYSSNNSIFSAATSKNVHRVESLRYRIIRICVSVCVFKIITNPYHLQRTNKLNSTQLKPLVFQWLSWIQLILWRSPIGGHWWSLVVRSSPAEIRQRNHQSARVVRGRDCCGIYHRSSLRSHQRWELPELNGGLYHGKIEAYRTKPGICQETMFDDVRVVSGRGTS